jgi:hypothetical protein
MSEQVNRLLDEYGAGLDRAAARRPGDYMHRPGGGRAVAVHMLEGVRRGELINVSSILRAAGKKAGISVNVSDMPALRAAVLATWPTGTAIS